MVNFGNRLNMGGTSFYDYLTNVGCKLQKKNKSSEQTKIFSYIINPS